MNLSARVRVIGALCVALIVRSPQAAAAAPPKAKTTIRLGTIAPSGSSFDKTLRAMGEQWRVASDGGVQVKVYPNGAKGGEAEMVRLMNNKAMDAALLTAVGLSEIDPAVQALQSIPLMFRSLEEVDYVGEKLRPRLEKQLRERGYIVLFWADAGWVRFFSKTAVVHPDDLRRAKLFSWAGDVKYADLYKSAGFKPVSLETNDILPGLQTGMINAVPLPPYVALAMQVYPLAPHMLELNWAPLVGALVIRENTWNKFTPEIQRAFAAAAAKAGREMKKVNRLQSDQSVGEMKKRGLKVHSVPPSAEAEWRKLATQAYPRIRGNTIAADLFDEVQRHVSNYRAMSDGQSK